MKYIFAILTAACLGFYTQAADLDELVDQLASEDYDERFAAYDQIESMVAQATNPDIDREDRNDVEADILDYALNDSLSTEARVWLLRHLQTIGSAKSVEGLSELSQNTAEDALLRLNAIKALAAIQSSTAASALLDGLLVADELTQPAYINALAYQNDALVNSDLLQAIQNGDIIMNENVVLMLSKIGGRKASELLFSHWLELAPSQRLRVEQAILDAGGSSDVMDVLIDESQFDSTRIAAFIRLIEMNPDNARMRLQTVLQDAENPLRSQVIAIAIRAEPNLRDLIIDQIDSLDVADQILVLSAIAEQGLPEYEDKVLAMLETEDLDLKLAAIDTLSAIGGEASIPVLLDYLGSDDDDIQEAATQAVGVLADPALDAQLIDNAQNGDPQTRLSAIELLGVRNSEGAIDLLNDYLINAEDADIQDATLGALERIGDVESAKLMLIRMFIEDESATLRDLQISLKRLTMQQVVPNFFWENIYEPALDFAPDSESRIAIIQILDGLSYQGAIDYCLELMESEEGTYGSAIDRVFRRWRFTNIGDYWISLTTEEGATQETIDDAFNQVIRLMESDNVARNGGDKFVLGAKAFTEIPGRVRKSQILNQFSNIDPNDAWYFTREFRDYQDDPDFGERITEMIEATR